MFLQKAEYTDFGMRLESRAQQAETIRIRALQIGDHALSGGNLAQVTECFHPIVTVPVDMITDSRMEDGMVKILVLESTIIEAFKEAGTERFLYGEYALLAEDPDDGGKLKAMVYNNAGEGAEEIALYNNPSIVRLILEFYLPISRAAKIDVTIGTDPAYVTPGMAEQMITKHENDENAHKPQFDAVFAKIKSVSAQLDAHADSKQAHGLSVLLRPDGRPIQSNIHGLTLASLLTKANRVDWGNESTVSGHGLIIDGFALYWGAMRDLGVGDLSRPPSRSVNFPVPFADNSYRAWTQAENSGATFYVQNKTANGLTVRLSAGLNVDGAWWAMGWTKPLEQFNDLPTEAPAPEIPLQELPTPEGVVYARLVISDGTIYGNYYTESGRLLYYRPDTKLYYDALLHPAPIALPGKSGATVYARYEKNVQNFYTTDSPSEQVFFDAADGTYYTLSGVGATGVPRAYSFTTANNWQAAVNDEHSLSLAVGSAGIQYAVVSVTDAIGEAKEVNTVIAEGIVTITAKEPFDGVVTVVSVAAEVEA